MRIAQVSPLYERVPPVLYGGTERVVSYLTEELVRLGHEVTLFASGDSVTHARLEAACPRALRQGAWFLHQWATGQSRERFDRLFSEHHLDRTKSYRPTVTCDGQDRYGEGRGRRIDQWLSSK